MNLKRFWSEICIEAGCDEVGRGCLAGPVVAAAVIIDEKFDHNLINDSKKTYHKGSFRIRPIHKGKCGGFRDCQKFHLLSLMSITY